MDERLKLYFESEKTQFSIAPFSAWRLISVSGLGCVSAKTDFALRAEGDGEEILGQKIGRRDIEMVLGLSYEEAISSAREALCHFFVPGRSGDLTVDRGNGKRRISYLVGACEVKEVGREGRQEARLLLHCARPWFYGDAVVLPLCEREPLLTFPFLSLAERGMSAGLSTRKRLLYLDNPGQVAVGMVYDVKVVKGSVRNPYVYCNGKRVTVLGTLNKGDCFTVSTVAGDCFVRVNGEDAPFDRRSSFAHARCGRSMVMVSALGSGSMDGEIRMIPCYMHA